MIWRCLQSAHRICWICSYKLAPGGVWTPISGTASQRDTNWATLACLLFKKACLLSDSWCMVRLLKWLEMTGTYCKYPDLVSSPPFYGRLLDYREQNNLQQFKSIKFEIEKNRVNIKLECVNWLFRSNLQRFKMR